LGNPDSPIATTRSTKIGVPKVDALTHLMVIILFTILVWLGKRQCAYRQEQMRLHRQAEQECRDIRLVAEDAASDAAACIAVVDKMCNKAMSRRHLA
jgi:hypothetical protein